MNGWDRQRLIAALISLATALFVATGTVALRHRRRMRWATILLYLIALAIALVATVRWLVADG